MACQRQKGYSWLNGLLASYPRGLCLSTEAPRHSAGGVGSSVRIVRYIPQKQRCVIHTKNGMICHVTLSIPSSGMTFIPSWDKYELRTSYTVWATNHWEVWSI